MADLILVVDDEPRIVRLAQDYLEKHGFRVITAADGEAALTVARREQPSLIVLDIMLPKLDGREVCRILRNESAVPIIMLTALAEEVDQVTGLELGADDYITKPFSPRALVARVRALLRRTRAVPGHNVPVRLAGLHIDPRAYTATLGSHDLQLTPIEFRLLHLFASHPAQVFSRAQLLETLNGAGAPFDRSIDSHIKNLRKKMRTAAVYSGAQQPAIETVYAVGYRLVTPELGHSG